MTSPRKPSAITRWLERAPRAALVVYAMGAAFATYFCMYAFRKPFAAAQFEGETFLGTEVALKTTFVIAQILGYTLSKYAGIKILSEMSHTRRALMLVSLITVAELALVLFGALPGDAKVIGIFANGLPLGMVWGLVVSYLEGRRTSELLLAGLSCSFIVSSGVVKDVGVTVMHEWGVSEAWMPAVVGALFIVPFGLFVWLLDQIPEPDEADVADRVERPPMDGKSRRHFVKRFLPGLIALLIVYFFLTAFRDFRDNYGIDIFAELGYADRPAIFTRTEVPVAFGVMFAMGMLNLIRDNKWGFVGAFFIMFCGVVMLGVSTWMLDSGQIDGPTWMILTGLGSYLAYVPYNSVLFDRMIAYTRVTGTAVFAIYLADAIGYTGSIGTQLYKDLGQTEMSYLTFFRDLNYVMCGVGAVLLVAALAYFLTKGRPDPAKPDPVAPSPASG